MRDGELDDLCSRIAKQLDVYEFLDVLDFTMEDLVVSLRNEINEHSEDFEDAAQRIADFFTHPEQEEETKEEGNVRPFS